MGPGLQPERHFEREIALPPGRTISPEVIEVLVSIAREVSKNSYSPYSRFAVGAAILTETGRIYSGCNVENASYGLTNCAERTAIFNAVSAGERGVKAVVIFTSTDEPAPPCGACRQVINEFGPDCLVVSVGKSDKKLMTAASELLPGAFGPMNLIRS